MIAIMILGIIGIACFTAAVTSILIRYINSR